MKGFPPVPAAYGPGEPEEVGPHFERYGPMDKDNDSLTPLKNIIASLLQDGTLPFKPEDANIWEEWDGVVGPSISDNARPSWIRNGVLRVRVSNAVWLQELKFLEEDIRRDLNKTLGREAVKKIEFRVGGE
ncbi:MAG: DUF721 domain-containing protein [Desulfobacteraceae bacterium]|nr:DUF721 domain-containing protein [Desulfobacteraceae bacterium]